MSLERDLLDAEPMKELSSKRPLVRSEINGQTVLLKVIVNSDLKIGRYKREWWYCFSGKKTLITLFSKVGSLADIMIVSLVWLPNF